jgi:U-box domain
MGSDDGKIGVSVQVSALARRVLLPNHVVIPVIAPDGNSYERDAIKKWIRTHGTSPVTRETVALDQLRPNNALYELIQGEKKRTLESMHPSIRRWKESTAETSRRSLTDAASAEETEERGGCVGA